MRRCWYPSAFFAMTARCDSQKTSQTKNYGKSPIWCLRSASYMTITMRERVMV